MKIANGAAIIASGQVHFIDHLAPLCRLLDVPLVAWDEAVLYAARTYYPGLRLEQIEPSRATLEYFYERYETLLLASPWSALLRLGAVTRNLEHAWGKRLRVVHCPHGFSDKVYWFKHLMLEELVLAYGQNMLDMLASIGIDMAGRHVLGGNLRYHYYQQEKPFFDAITASEALRGLRTVGRTILYAPTWQDQAGATSFLSACEPFLQGLPEGWNAIVKLHPHLVDSHPDVVDRLSARFPDRTRIAFVKKVPLVYPFLSRADVYLGDASSVGYDFLSFNRPMFFLNEHARDGENDRQAYLFRCGTVIPRHDYPAVHDIIAKALVDDAARFTAVRTQVYNYTFAERNPKAVAEELATACQP